MTPTPDPPTNDLRYPRIDGRRCLGDGGCVVVCQSRVFVWDAFERRPVVANPGRCVSGCRACADACPGEGISLTGEEK